jgi:hypothetical protein
VKIFFLMALFVVGIVMSASADVLYWFSYSVENRQSGTITEADGWVVALYDSVSKELLYSSTAGWNDVDWPGDWDLDIVSPDVSWSGRSVFTRFYDAKTIAGAVWYADSEVKVLPTWTPSTPPSPPVEIYYEIGTISATAWQVIPEPMTATVLVACAMMLGLKKLSRARQRD